MDRDYPKDPESWAQMAQDSLAGNALDDLNSRKRRPFAERYCRIDHTPRARPIPLSGSTAKVDDFLFLRAIVTSKAGNSDGLRRLIDSRYTDHASWEKALQRLGLRVGGKNMKLVAAVDDGEVTAIRRSTASTSAVLRGRVTTQDEVHTPVRQTSKAETLQVPPAPKKMPPEEKPRFAEGTRHFHCFIDALCLSSPSTTFHETAKPDVYGAFYTALRMFYCFKPRQTTDGKASKQISKTLPLSIRPAGSESPTPTLRPVVSLLRARLEHQSTPTPGARLWGKGKTGVGGPTGGPAVSSAAQPSPPGAEDEDEDEDDEDKDELGISEPVPDDDRITPDETCITLFASVFICQLAAMQLRSPAGQPHILIPDRLQFCFAPRSRYAVNACVDGVIYKAGCTSLEPTDDQADRACRQLLTAEFKADRNQPVLVQMAFEIAAKISARYSKGGEDIDFEGRRYELAIYQCGTNLGIILAEYGRAWVQYTENGKNKVVPREDLKEEDMLVLRPLARANLGDKASVYFYSALIAAVLEKDAAGNA